MPALFSRHFPQPDLSTVVAPSGGVQQTAITQNEGTATAPTNPPKNGLPSYYLAGSPEVTSTSSRSFVFLLLPSIAAPSFRGVQSLMGCKQYARMLGLSRGYPYILYLSLGKWDAAPLPGLFHKVTFQEMPRAESSAARWSCATCICNGLRGRQVAAQNSSAAHAIISARAELRRFRSEMGKFRRFSRGFSTAGPMVT